MLSDFVAPERYRDELAILAHRHTVHTFLLTDPLEGRMPSVGLIALEDAETGEVRLVDSGTLAAQQPPEQRLRALRRTGSRASLVTTADDPITVLHRHFQRAERRRR